MVVAAVGAGLEREVAVAARVVPAYGDEGPRLAHVSQPGPAAPREIRRQAVHYLTYGAGLDKMVITVITDFTDSTFIRGESLSLIHPCLFISQLVS